MFDFVKQPIRLKYWTGTQIVDAGPVKFGEEWYDVWLEAMVRSAGEKEGFIFFLMVETTDVFEEEFNLDLNEARYMIEGEVYSTTHGFIEPSENTHDIYVWGVPFGDNRPPLNATRDRGLDEEDLHFVEDITDWKYVYFFGPKEN